MCPETIDLAARLTPHPNNVIVVEASEDLAEVKRGDLVLLNTARMPADGDLVLDGDHLINYRLGMNSFGVAYCAIHFLN